MNAGEAIGEGEDDTGSRDVLGDNLGSMKDEKKRVHWCHFRGNTTWRKIEIGEGSAIWHLFRDGNCLHLEVPRIFSLRCKSL